MFKASAILDQTIKVITKRKKKEKNDGDKNKVNDEEVKTEENDAVVKKKRKKNGKVISEEKVISGYPGMNPLFIENQLTCSFFFEATKSKHPLFESRDFT